MKDFFTRYWKVILLGTGFLLVFFLLVYLIFFTDFLKNLLLSLEYFIQNHTEYVYLLAFLIAITEGTIILGLMPGTSYIITLGVFWARGDIDPFLLFPLVILGATLGDLLGYALGSYSSKFIKKRYKDNTEYLIAKKFIAKHGAKSVFIARFVSGMKEIVPFAAGILNMNLKKFMFFNFLGAIGWAFLWIMVGYISGFFITDIEHIVKTVGAVLLIFFVIGVYIFYRRHTKN